MTGHPHQLTGYPACKLTGFKDLPACWLVSLWACRLSRQGFATGDSFGIRSFQIILDTNGL
jgi:hypothetical protein